MIVSHKHKFIFLKTAKTAGTSCEMVLSSICGPKDIITKIGKDEELQRKTDKKFRTAQNYYIPLTQYSKRDYLECAKKRNFLKFKNHDAASKVKNKLPNNVWNSYYKFCFERHPVDKTISYYRWCLKSKYFKGSFDDFIQSGIFSKIKGYNTYSINGLPVVDKIFKYEDINTAFKYLSEKFQEDFKVDISNVKAKKIKISNNETIKISNSNLKKVELVFAREIKLLQYKL